MSSRRCERRKQCGKKERYSTIAQARSIAWRQRCRTQGDDIAAYKCQFCNGWHIGHRSAKKLRF
jgi:hypothetical protein